MPQCLRCGIVYTDFDGKVLIRYTDTNICELVTWTERTQEQRHGHVLRTEFVGSCGLCNQCMLNQVPER